MACAGGSADKLRAHDRLRFARSRPVGSRPRASTQSTAGSGCSSRNWPTAKAFGNRSTESRVGALLLLAAREPAVASATCCRQACCERSEAGFNSSVARASCRVCDLLPIGSCERKRSRFSPCHLSSDRLPEALCRVKAAGRIRNDGVCAADRRVSESELSAGAAAGGSSRIAKIHWPCEGCSYSCRPSGDGGEHEHAKRVEKLVADCCGCGVRSGNRRGARQTVSIHRGSLRDAAAAALPGSGLSDRSRDQSGTGRRNEDAPDRTFSTIHAISSRARK